MAIVLFLVKLTCFFLLLLGNQEAPETRDSHHRSQDTDADPIRIQYLNNMIQVEVEAWMKGETNQMLTGNRNFQRLQQAL